MTRQFRTIAPLFKALARTLQNLRRMRVAKGSVVAIDYTIRDVDGRVVDTTIGRKPFVYLHGYEQIVRGVEKALTGRTAGTALEISITPPDAYGNRDPAAVMVLPRKAFPIEDPPEVGSLYRALRPDGKPVMFTVLEVTSEQVIVDANHPLAGQTLLVSVEVLSVRSATAEEQAHEHVHGESAAVSHSSLS
jgi:FKBP-type peptidyl-prolyl cis-trans isomerase SlyD